MMAIILVILNEKGNGIIPINQVQVLRNDFGGLFSYLSTCNCFPFVHVQFVLTFSLDVHCCYILGVVERMNKMLQVVE